MSEYVQIDYYIIIIKSDLSILILCNFLKELEEFVIQKIAETITMRSEIGQLREQARITEKLHEATRTKLQQLMKQMKDFETVLSRNAADRRQNDKPVAPIKINRSVGLQVNFITVFIPIYVMEKKII